MVEIEGAELIIVGAGFYGATIAERAAEYGRRVLVIDRRPHIAGNAFTETHGETGIEIHRYGPHFFHTSNAEVWDYVRRFANFVPFELRVWSTHAGQMYPMPINLATICQFFGRRMSPDEARDLIASQAGAASEGEPANLEDKAIRSIGRPLYEAFIRGYTQKQWQTDPRELPAAIISRLPVRYTFDNRYFSDPFQALPENGYTALVERMLSHERITTVLGTEWSSIRSSIPSHIPVVYTGPIDQYFGYAEGELAWRTTGFETETMQTGDYQGAPVVNYPDADVPFTRIVEYRHFYPARPYPTDRTVITREYPRFASRTDEPFYPIDTSADRKILARYRERAAQETNIHFGGRLGTYTYLDMHQAIALALRDWRTLSARYFEAA